MFCLLLAALLPGLYWEGGAETAPALRQAGIQRLYVPAARLEAWRAAGFDAVSFDPARAEKTDPPGVQYKISEASATRVPWIDANGWRFARERTPRMHYCAAPAGQAALAAAEGYAYATETVVRPDPADLPAFGRMLQFLRGIDRPPLPTLANFGVIDDGSEETGEVLNLMARRNLLFRVVSAPDPRLDLNLRVPKEEAADPYAFAVKVRQQLTDAKRLLRIFGSELVLGRLTGEGGQARLHLLDYGGRTLKDLRVRVRGPYTQGRYAAFGAPSRPLEDLAPEPGALEFTIPEMQTYAVIDLQ